MRLVKKGQTEDEEFVFFFPLQLYRVEDTQVKEMELLMAQGLPRRPTVMLAYSSAPLGCATYDRLMAEGGLKASYSFGTQFLSHPLSHITHARTHTTHTCHTCTHTHTHATSAHTYTHAHTHTHIHTCYICTHTHILHLHTHTHMLHLHTHTCYICTHTHAICTHTHRTSTHQMMSAIAVSTTRT